MGEYPTQPLLESIRVRQSSRRRTKPAGRTALPTCHRMPNTTRTPRRRGHERSDGEMDAYRVRQLRHVQRPALQSPLSDFPGGPDVPPGHDAPPDVSATAPEGIVGPLAGAGPTR